MKFLLTVADGTGCKQWMRVVWALRYQKCLKFDDS